MEHPTECDVTQGRGASMTVTTVACKPWKPSDKLKKAGVTDGMFVQAMNPHEERKEKYALVHLESGLVAVYGSGPKNLTDELEGVLSRMKGPKFRRIITNQKPLAEAVAEAKKAAEDQERRRRVWKELKDIFGFTPALDGLISAFSGTICLDVIKLDRQLRVPDGKSMRQFITEEYGPNVCAKVESIMTP